MTLRRFAVAIVTLAAVLAIPSIAHAQQIRGTVKDATGGALPGVTVEAKSDVLIEGTKSTQSDGEGQFTIADLRPGKYSVVFTLQGFQTITNKDVIVNADLTTALNAEMKVGGRGEELTVSGVSTTVDVQNATHTTSLERSVLDNLPIGNNIWEMAQMIPAIDMYSDFTHRASSVGGSLGAVQTYMSVNGQLSSNNVIMVDGMSVSGLELNGTVQAYFNNDMNSEVSYQTSGISADRSGGGVTVNMIPREGGNRFSGDFKSSYRPESMIGDNVGCDLKYTTSCLGQDSSLNTRLNSMGLNSKSSLRFLADETISQGGPVMKNKLWFFGSYHQFNTSDLTSNVFTNVGDQFTDDQQIIQGSGRLTWQANPKTKLTGYYDRTRKTRSGDISQFEDPETAAVQWTSPNYSTGNIKLTSTATSRLLFEGGYSFNREHRNTQAVDGIAQARGTDAWYAGATRVVTGGARNTAPTTTLVSTWPGRDNYQGSLSYVTGSHQLKAGVQWQTGAFFHDTQANADGSQIYTVQTKASCPGGGTCTNAQLVADPNGYEYKLSSPTSVTTRNTGVQSVDRLNDDIGIYFQDSYRYKRVTLNPGLRWEHVNAQNDAYTSAEGRWVPTRSINGVKNVPDWYDWAPRFNAVWDVFGNARTAVKYSLNRYNQAAATALANSFNTLTSTTRTLPWNDKNGNDIVDGNPGFVYDAKGNAVDYGAGFYNCVNPSGGATSGFLDANNPCEVNMSTLKSANGALFGTPAAEQAYQGFPRSWLLENIVEVQHALTRRLSITGSWTRSDGKDLTKTVNGAYQAGDWVPTTIYNPLDGTPMTYFALKDLETQTRQNNSAAQISYIEPQRQQINQTYSMEFRMRPYAGAQIFGGITAQRFESVNCNTSIAGYVVDPNDLRFCDSQNMSAVDDHGIFDSARTGSIAGYQILGFSAQSGIADTGGRQPLAKDFRLGVSLPLPWHGVNLGVNYLNNDEGSFSTLDPINFTVTLANTGFSSTTCGGGTTRYTDGLTGCSNAAGTGAPAAGDAIIKGTSNTRKIATAAAPACPTTYGCVPGALVVPTSFITSSGATTITRQLLPNGRVRRERLNQFDLKVSKTFRVNNFSILPTLEAANIFNQDKINSVTSTTYATTGGTYAIPSTVLQSRIIGFGVQVRW